MPPTPPDRSSRGPGSAPAGADEPDRLVRPRRTISLYALLASLPMLVLVPLLAFSLILLQLLADQARQATREELRATNLAMTATVERELSHARQILRLLAESPALAADRVEPGPLAALAREMTRTNVGLQTLAIVDAQGLILLEYPPRVGGDGRISLMPHQLKAMETNQVVVSPLYRSADEGRLSLDLNYPVWRAGRIPFLVTARLDIQHYTGVMASHLAGRDDALATLLDAQARIISQTRDLDRFLGQLPSRQTLAAVQSAPAGVQRIATLDGNEYLWAWSTTVDGWRVMTGIPARLVDAVMRESLLRLVLVGGVLLMLGGSAAALLARRFAQTVDRMARDAPALARGEATSAAVSGVRQLDALREALASAGQQVVQALGERDQALQAERAARAQADEDNRAKDVFIATLSHELRNPLSPIRAAASILQSSSATEAQRARAVAIIERQATAMARLLEDLLDISRIGSGRISLDLKPVDLKQVLEEALEVVRPLIEARHHRLEVVWPSVPVMLQADPLRLSQVFANLLTNAAKYTDPGGRIDIQVEALPGELRVRIRDSGIGLEAQALEQVFQPFAQVRGATDRSQGGLGIGLSLVRGLVRLHGGWVRAISEGLGRGSEFIVALPVRPPGRAPA